jgi:hypothetical protein
MRVLFVAGHSWNVAGAAAAAGLSEAGGAILAPPSGRLALSARRRRG